MVNVVVPLTVPSELAVPQDVRFAQMQSEAIRVSCTPSVYVVVPAQVVHSISIST